MPKVIEQKKRSIKSPIKRYNESLSEDQAIAKKVMASNIITCINGQAGTGKSFLGVAYALEKLAREKKHGGVEGVIITRPVVFEERKNLGFLPGDLMSKIDPWLKPMTEIVMGLEGGEAYEKMIKEGILDIAPLMVIEGRTFTNKVVLVDEAQNLTKLDFEEIFTRVGKNSQLIFMGDDRQCKLPNKSSSGFRRMCELSNESDNVGFARLFTNFRSEIVEELLRKY